MRRFIAPLVFLSVVILAAFIHSQAQNLPTPSVGYTMTATQDPTHCTPGFTPLNWRQDLAALRYCSATDTWATLGSGGGSSVTVGAGVPAGTCTAGALYLRNDTVNSIQQFYVCGPTNTWQLSSYLTGSSAPTNCATGQIFLNTSSGTLSYCSSPGNPGTWTSLSGSGNVTAGATLTNNGCIAGGGTSAIQAVAGCSIDSSGNLSTAGGLTTGNGSSTTGILKLKGATSGNTVQLTVAATTNAGVFTLPGVTGTAAYSSSAGTSGHCVQYGSDGLGLSDAGSACGSGGGGTTVQTGTIESIGSCTSTAFLYLITDAPYDKAYCNGASVLTYFMGGQAVTPPTGTFAWTNQGSATVTAQTNGAWSFDFPSHGATSNSVNAYDTATPSVPFTSVYRATMVEPSLSGDGDLGFVLRESGTGKLITVGAHADVSGTCAAGPCFAVAAWNSNTSFSATLGTLSTGQYLSGLAFLPATIKISVASGASGAITISWSPDGGVTYVQLYSAAKNAFFTTAPDHIGYYGNNNTNGAKDIYLTAIGIN